jgi:mycothiol synthase
MPLSQLDDDLFSSALSVVQRYEHGIDPIEPPITTEELRLIAADDRTDGNRHERVAVIDGDQVRAVAHLELELDEANAHFASTEIFGAGPDPDAGRVALAALMDVAEADGRTTLMTWGPTTAAEAAFWTDLGAEQRYTERMSALEVGEVDEQLMAAWIAQRIDRAADVELVRWVGRCPSAHLDAWIESRTAMNDAPKEGIEFNDWTLDAGDIREEEDARRVLGTTVMSLLALDPDGEPVGHTSVHVNTHRPAASFQWDTVVLDHHRRRGVGRWLKAEMWRWIRNDEPDVSRLRTGNAASNDSMLSINVGMGYREAAILGAWQADMSVYRAALG